MRHGTLTKETAASGQQASECFYRAQDARSGLRDESRAGDAVLVADSDHANHLRHKGRADVQLGLQEELHGQHKRKNEYQHAPSGIR